MEVLNGDYELVTTYMDTHIHICSHVHMLCPMQSPGDTVLTQPLLLRETILIDTLTCMCYEGCQALCLPGICELNLKGGERARHTVQEPHLDHSCIPRTLDHALHLGGSR